MDDRTNLPGTATPAEYWERVFAARSWGSYPAEELVRFIASNFRAVPDKTGVRVLEIGCGPGPNIWYLAREGFAVAGIDGSPTAIRQAKERLIAEGLPHKMPLVDLKVGDFSELPWADESFNAVVEVAALYANPMTKIMASIAEVRRVLEPGGAFFGRMFGTLTTGSDSGEMIEPGTRRNPKIGPCAGNDIAHFFSREELVELFSGFSKLGIDQTHRTARNGEIQIFEWLVSAQK